MAKTSWGFPVLKRKTEPREFGNAVEMLMWDSNQRLVLLRVTREALEIYYRDKRDRCTSMREMVLGAAYREILDAANRLYQGRRSVKPVRLVVTSKVLNG